MLNFRLFLAGGAAFLMSGLSHAQIAVPDAPEVFLLPSESEACAGLNATAKEYCEFFVFREQRFVSGVNFNDKGRFQVDRANYLRGYLDAYEVTGNTYFLDRFVNMARAIIMDARTPDDLGYIGYGWNRIIGPRQTSDRWVLHSGRILTPLLQFVLLVSGDVVEGTQTMTEYEEVAEIYLETAVKVMDEHMNLISDDDCMAPTDAPANIETGIGEGIRNTLRSCNIFREDQFCAQNEANSDVEGCGATYDHNSFTVNENVSIAEEISRQESANTAFFFWGGDEENFEFLALVCDPDEVDNDNARCNSQPVDSDMRWVQLRGRPLTLNQQLSGGSALLLLSELSRTRYDINTGRSRGEYVGYARGVGRLLSRDIDLKTVVEDGSPVDPVLPGGRVFPDYTEGRYRWGHVLDADNTAERYNMQLNKRFTEDVGHGAITAEFITLAREIPFNIGNSGDPFPSTESGSLPNEESDNNPNNDDFYMKRFANTITEGIYCNFERSVGALPQPGSLPPLQNDLDLFPAKQRVNDVPATDTDTTEDSSCSGGNVSNALGLWLDLAAWDNDTKSASQIREDMADGDYTDDGADPNELNKVYWVTKCWVETLPAPAPNPLEGTNVTAPQISAGYAKLAKWATRLDDTTTDAETADICDELGF